MLGCGYFLLKNFSCLTYWLGQCKLKTVCRDLECINCESGYRPCSGSINVDIVLFSPELNQGELESKLEPLPLPLLNLSKYMNAGTTGGSFIRAFWFRSR
eukprot:4099035-Amphidinium_carterae.1